ncbi:MAG: DUF4166 domain-containing protein [Ignavibacteriae bacterium]|nr:DUF4166 domain-containing protein [Ignavibacteriota bacterium]
MSIYRDILRERWNDVSPKVRASHLTGEELHANCCLDIAGSSNILGRIVSRIVSFPRAKAAAEVELRIRSSPEGEIWERFFPDCTLNSLQSVSPDGHLIDRFGKIAFRFNLEVSNGCIHHHHTDTYLTFGSLNFRLPRFVSPRVTSHEEPDPTEDASRISVSVHMPVIGYLLTYSGIVRPTGNRT